VVRQHPPAAAGAGVVADGVDDLAQVHLPGPAASGAAGLGAGQVRGQALPLVLGQVGRVRFAVHTRTLAKAGQSRSPVFVHTFSGVSVEWHVNLRKPKGGSDMGHAGLSWEDGAW